MANDDQYGGRVVPARLSERADPRSGRDISPSEERRLRRPETGAMGPNSPSVVDMFQAYQQGRLHGMLHALGRSNQMAPELILDPRMQIMRPPTGNIPVGPEMPKGIFQRMADFLMTPYPNNPNAPAWAKDEISRRQDPNYRMGEEPGVK